MHEYEESLDAFDLVIRIHPDCPEAHWFRGDTLRELGRIGEAMESWQAYLKFDQRGPWAEMARQYLDQYAGEESDREPQRQSTNVENHRQRRYAGVSHRVHVRFSIHLSQSIRLVSPFHGWSAMLV